MKDALMFEATKVIFSGDDPNGGDNHKDPDEFYDLTIFLKDGRILSVYGCPHCGMLSYSERFAPK